MDVIKIEVYGGINGNRYLSSIKLDADNHTDISIFIFN
jgi:hypothetical protein